MWVWGRGGGPADKGKGNKFCHRVVCSLITVPTSHVSCGSYSIEFFRYRGYFKFWPRSTAHGRLRSKFIASEDFMHTKKVNLISGYTRSVINGTWFCSAGRADHEYIVFTSNLRRIFEKIDVKNEIFRFLFCDFSLDSASKGFRIISLNWCWTWINHIDMEKFYCSASWYS